MQAKIKLIGLAYLILVRSILCAQDTDSDLLTKGQELYDQEKYTEASEIFTGLLETDPGNNNIRYFLANSLLGEGKYEKAIKQYSKIINYNHI